MKYLFMILALCCTSFGFATEMMRYTFTNFDYQVDLPSEWTINQEESCEEEENLEIVFNSSLKDRQFSIAAYKISSEAHGLTIGVTGFNLDSFVDALRTAILEEYEELEISEEEKNTTLANLDSLEKMTLNGKLVLVSPVIFDLEDSSYETGIIQITNDYIYMYGLSAASSEDVSQDELIELVGPIL